MQTQGKPQNFKTFFELKKIKEKINELSRTELEGVRKFSHSIDFTGKRTIELRTISEHVQILVNEIS